MYVIVAFVVRSRWSRTCWTTSHVTSVRVRAATTSSRRSSAPTSRACSTTARAAGARFTRTLGANSTSRWWKRAQTAHAPSHFAGVSQWRQTWHCVTIAVLRATSLCLQPAMGSYSVHACLLFSNQNPHMQHHDNTSQHIARYRDTGTCRITTISWYCEAQSTRSSTRICFQAARQ